MYNGGSSVVAKSYPPSNYTQGMVWLWVSYDFHSQTFKANVPPSKRPDFLIQTHIFPKREVAVKQPAPLLGRKILDTPLMYKKEKWTNNIYKTSNCNGVIYLT